MNKSTISIRQLKPEEWGILRDIRLRAVKECERVYLANYEEVLQKQPEDWRDIIDGEDRAIFVLFDGEQPVGLGSVFTVREDPSGQTGIMAMGYIDPLYRRRSLSYLLYKARIEWARAHPVIEKLTISHREGNEASRHAMEKHGFQKVGKDKIRFGDGSEDWDHRYQMVFDKT